MEEKWVVVGAPTMLDTVEQEGVLLNSSSDPFTPVKNQKFKRALESGRVAMVKAEPKKPMMTKQEFYAMKLKAREAEAKRKEISKRIVAKPATGAPVEVPVESSDFVSVLVGLGLNKKVAKKLVDAGFEDLDELKAAEDDDLLEISGVGASTIAHIREAVEG